VHDSGAEVKAGVDSALAARRRDLERRLALKADRRQALAAGGRAEQPEARALDLDVELAAGELDRLDGELRRQSPRYSELTRPGAASTAEIGALLDPGTLLLEYALGRDRSYLWAVEAGSLHAFTLPGRAAIERAARAFHRAVSHPPDPGGGDRARRAGEALGRTVLGPVARELGRKRLAIVADGALHYISFDALPEPGPAGGAPLLDRHETVELPSASVLAAERRDLAHRRPAPRLCVVLADPVFEPDDPRVVRGHPAPPGAARSAAAAAASRPRSGDADAVPRLVRLRFSRREAEAIAALGRRGAVDAELDFDASRELALSGRLRDYRYIHFATHGLLDAARPQLSGLALSSVDAAGRSRDGFLRLRDLYDLDLSADLVVLSGCRTALGREIAGEGLLGLTRGFFYAGAPRVVASLWWVDDRATSELMASFYRGLWIEGLGPAAALRQARRALAARRRYRDPFYWGAFVLQGDWR
jgi:CHAT domain-containing protein